MTDHAALRRIAEKARAVHPRKWRSEPSPVDPKPYRNVHFDPDGSDTSPLLPEIANYIVAFQPDVILALLDAAPVTSIEAHEPGDNHQYEIECKVCGESGVIRLTVDPERAAPSQFEMNAIRAKDAVHVLPVNADGEPIRGHKAETPCPACAPEWIDDGRGSPVWSHRDPTFPGAKGDN